MIKQLWNFVSAEIHQGILKAEWKSKVFLLALLSTSLICSSLASTKSQNDIGHDGGAKEMYPLQDEDFLRYDHGKPLFEDREGIQRNQPISIQNDLLPYKTDKPDGIYVVSNPSESNYDSLVLHDRFISHEDLIELKQELLPGQRRFIHLKVTKRGSEKMHTSTKANVGGMIALVLGGYAISLPRIYEPVSTRTFQITVDCRSEIIDNLLKDLKKTGGTPFREQIL